ncbi:MAG: hypothetical protein HY474_00835 [Candidatus Sungbacteria bacterium]|uniref:TraC-like domain-containing protein n=1 Tax=Candidatus Sungiibacteriota bacterium TaxID=2750080 RepID=A0A932YXS8_9BACT|nr:hypothetical protein [Candidatus Sungbacteria bacterium]
MPPSAAQKSKSAAAAQEFLPIDSIRDGVIVLKGGQGLRAVLMVSSLNFALKSEEEQDALVFQYENFLNALDFPLQLVIQSRRLNIRPYLEVLAERQKEEENELLKVQIGEYAEFVKSFVEMTGIVTKTFFAVVPFSPSMMERGGGFLKSLSGLLGRSPKGGTAADGNDFEQEANQLAQRVDTVTAAMKRLGLRVARLNTEELIELFYGLYNPGETQRAAQEKNNEHP